SAPVRRDAAGPCEAPRRTGGVMSTRIDLFNHAKDTLDLTAGDVLFSQGDEADVMYAVLEGAVDIVFDGRVIETIEPGGVIGELALVDDSPRSAGAVASQPSRLARIDRREFTFLVHEHPTFAVQVMAVMAERLRRANSH